jgi:hypothetical protein
MAEWIVAFPTTTPHSRSIHIMQPRTKREYLRELVEGKNRSSRPLTEEEKSLGFLGWHERGYLPHCDFPGLVQFVTFRLIDSLPTSRRGEWEHLLNIEDVREKHTRLEEYLDRGHGACQLRDPRIARLVEEALLHFHDERYEMLAWCVMPNHVHLLVHVWRTPLSRLERSWKHFVQTQVNVAIQERRPPARRDQAERPASGTARNRSRSTCAVPEAGVPMAARILGQLHARRGAGTHRGTLHRELSAESPALPGSQSVAVQQRAVPRPVSPPGPAASRWRSETARSVIAPCRRPALQT